MTRPLRRTGGLFARLHDVRTGPKVDLSSLDPASIPPDLLARARATWRQRFQTEFRSIQIMARFVEEVLGAGDPLEVYAGAVGLIEDELRHATLCAGVCEALGAPAVLPEPVPLRDPERFLRAPMPERALSTAVSMLAVSETISVGFVADLRERCAQPGVRAVLDATLADEAEHEGFGWAYVEASLRRFPRAAREDIRELVRTTLAPHREVAAPILEALPEARRALDAWPEPDLAALGLFGPERQALVFAHTLERTLLPKLRALELAPEG